MYANKILRLSLAVLLFISGNLSSLAVQADTASTTISPAIISKLDAFVVKVQTLHPKYPADADWNAFLDTLNSKIGALKPQYVGNTLILAVLDRLSSGVSNLKVQRSTNILSGTQNTSGCKQAVDANCNGIYDNKSPEGQDCSGPDKTGADFSPSTCFYAMGNTNSTAQNANSTTLSVNSAIVSSGTTIKQEFGYDWNSGNGRVFRISNPQGVLSSGGNPVFNSEKEIHVMEFTTGTGVHSVGRVSSVERLGYDNGNTELAISQTKGDFSDINCRTIPNFEPTLQFLVGEPIPGNVGDSLKKCILKPNTKYYLNIRLSQTNGCKTTACSVWFTMDHN